MSVAAPLRKDAATFRPGRGIARKERGGGAGGTGGSGGAMHRGGSTHGGGGMDEVILIERAKAGDGVAIRRLYDRYAPRVHTVVRRLAGDDALAEDWAQDAWVQAIRALPSFRHDARFSTWLHRIAVNAALHGRRSRERRTRREAVAPLALDRVAAAPSLLPLRIGRALDRLPAGMRQVLVLHDVEGYTHEEVAGLLGITAGTSKSQLFKARARMRDLLEPVREPNEGEEACLI
ncbi:MAG: RNA polymerase sigma factor [Longimicrobiales bacterium]